jgi:hypothetical protein
MAVPRKLVDPVTGIVYPNEAACKRAVRARTEAAATAQARRAFESAQHDDPCRLDNASEMMRQVREGVGMAYVPRSVTAPSSPGPTATRQFVGLDPHNIPSGVQDESGIQTDLHLLAKNIERERGITYTEAVSVVLRERPELGDRHRKEVIAAGARIAGQPLGDVVKKFDHLVETRIRETGGSYADAIAFVGREHRDLAQARNIALSRPVMMTNR